MRKFDIQRLPDMAYDLTAVQNALELFLNQHPMDSLNQINLTCKSESSGSEALYQGVGSLYDFQKKQWKDSEKDYRFLNPILRETIFEKIYQDLQKLFPNSVGRVRLMKLKPKSCYSFHIDNCQRVHLALQTDSHSCLVFLKRPRFEKWRRIWNKQVLSPVEIAQHYRIPADGCLYLADTRNPHSAINAGDFERIHLVASVF